MPGKDNPQDQGSEPTAAQTTTATPLTDAIVAAGHVARNDAQKNYARKLIAEFVDQLVDRKIPKPEDSSKADMVKLIQARIAEIDAELSGYLDEILHDKDFQKLEASWRGLHYLVFNTETSTSLKLRLLNAKRDEVAKDLASAIEFDQSVQFKQLYEEEYGTFGGFPYSVLVADYEFGRLPEDIEFLEKISGVAAAAHARCRPAAPGCPASRSRSGCRP